MYICECCGCGFEYEELKVSFEPRGEWWGHEACEEYRRCPLCGGEVFDGEEEE